MGWVVPIGIDFESHPIKPRPEFPPEPVGFGIRFPGKRSRYYAWGHPTENNCTKSQAGRVLKDAWRSGRPLLFHNAPFDCAVAETFFKLRFPRWDAVHDTTVLAFLDDPNAEKVSLKPLAERLLDWPSEERNELNEWIRANVPEAKKVGDKRLGEFIWRAPGKLVGRYCIGDVDRTLALWRLLLPSVMDAGMAVSYERERRLMPILHGMAKGGVPINAQRLMKDLDRWAANLDALDRWVRRRLKSPNLDLDKNAELADAMEYADVVDEWVYTEPSKTFPEGQRSTSFENLKLCCLDEPLVHGLEYRAKLTNAIRTFAEPWLEMADKSECDHIYCNWNQVRQAQERRKGRAFGARTGRLSSDPNLMNIPRVPPPVVTDARAFKDAKREGYDPVRLVKQLVDNLNGWQLPNLRDYVIAEDRGQVLVRDYSQQELRILAHYEAGTLLAAYHANPRMDLHAHAQKLINELLGTHFRRKPIKNTGFGIIYGMGLGLLAERIDEDVTTAKQIRTAYKAIFPGLKDLETELKRRGRMDEPILTWGGRVYYVEEPKMIHGRLRTFEYKLLNTLIQGSAADCSKQAMINYDETKKHGRLYLQVHDELVGGAPKKAAREEMEIMRHAMESVVFDLEMLSDGKMGRTWAAAK